MMPPSKSGFTGQKEYIREHAIKFEIPVGESLKKDSILFTPFCTFYLMRGIIPARRMS